MATSAPAAIDKQAPEVRAEYERLVAAGTAPWIAEMHATGSYPGLKTDTNYIPQRERTLRDQFKGDDLMFRKLIAAAKRKGFTPPKDCSYDPGLAMEFGDPAGFVPNGGGRSHIKDVLTKRNITADGPVPHTRIQKDPPKKSRDDVVECGGRRLAKDLADEVAKKLVKRDHKLALASKKEQRQEAAKLCGSLK